jgi:hypothetical protein
LGIELKTHAVFEKKGQTRDETREQHDAQIESVQVELHHEIETHDHVNGIEDHPVAHTHDLDEPVHVLPQSQVHDV